MNRRLFALVLLLCSLPAFAQRENTQYVIQYYDRQTNTVAAMLTKAQAACNSDTAIPCLIIFDPTLAKFPEGSLPAKCAQCVWIDYRTTTVQYTPALAGGSLPTGATISGSDLLLTGRMIATKFERPATLQATDFACGVNDYWTSPIGGTVNAWRICTNGVLGTLFPTQTIAWVAGCDQAVCPTLLDTDDQKEIYVNRSGVAQTFVEVYCKSDAGTPIINLTKNNATTVLASNLTCTTAGASSTVFSSAAFAVGDTLDFVIVTAGGVAKRITVVVTMK
jgi:hypothetical protein